MRARRRRQARVLPLAQAVLTGAHLLRLWSRRGGCALLIAMMALLADLGGLIVFGFLRKRRAAAAPTATAPAELASLRRLRAWPQPSSQPSPTRDPTKTVTDCLSGPGQADLVPAGQWTRRREQVSGPGQAHHAPCF